MSHALHRRGTGPTRSSSFAVPLLMLTPVDVERPNSAWYTYGEGACWVSHVACTNASRSSSFDGVSCYRGN